jgi:hypothetical protein
MTEWVHSSAEGSRPATEIFSGAADFWLNRSTLSTSFAYCKPWYDPKTNPAELEAICYNAGVMSAPQYFIIAAALVALLKNFFF